MNQHRTWLVSAAILLMSATAGAEKKTDTRAQPRDDYSYSFSDDGLLGGGVDSTVPRILVNPRRSGGTLIRPRTNFVIELLKTVETL
jgi:hypothetical protein